MPDHAGALDTGGVQEGHHVGGKVVDPVAAGRALGVAEAALVQLRHGCPPAWHRWDRGFHVLVDGLSITVVRG
jgi:hypothetical protein